VNPHRLHRRAILSALLAAALAGCGGGAKPPLSHSQLVAQANALCAASSLDLDALADLTPSPDDARAFRRFVAAEKTLAETDDPVERAAAEGRAEGYALQLELTRCARRHNSPS
jgi:hypothetical protein